MKILRNPLFLVILWASLMLIVSSTPGNKLPPVVSFWQWDKLAHFGEYLILAYLLARYLVHGKHLIIPAAFSWTIGIGAAFGAFDELHQLLIPMRTCAWQDFVADFAGVITGSLLFLKIRR